MTTQEEKMAKTNFYTRTGDKGDTSRLGAQTHIKKTSQLIDTLGTIDEATSAIGMARAMAQSSDLCVILLTVQRHIITLMSHLSATPEARVRYTGISDDEVPWLEDIIAKLEAVVPPLDHFVIPGDSTAGAALHVARSVVRRAERRLRAFAEIEPSIGQVNLIYLNRLSSLLFVAALVEDQLDSARNP
jgi:cob(I)alamin adenosyltransferase